MNSESTCVFCQRLEQRRPGKSLQIRRCPLCDGELLHDGRNGTSYRIDARPKQRSIAKRAIWGGMSALVVVFAAVALLHFTQPKPIYVTMKTAKVEMKFVRVGLLPYPKAALRMATDSVPLAKAKQTAAFVSVRKPLDSAIRRRIRMENVPPLRFVAAKSVKAKTAITRNKPLLPVARKSPRTLSEKDWAKTLLAVPEIGLDDTLHKKLFQEVAGQQSKSDVNFNPIEAGKKIRKTILAKNANWKCLPWRDDDCQIGPTQARILGCVSRRMRGVMAEFADMDEKTKKQQLNSDSPPDPYSILQFAHNQMTALQQNTLALSGYHQILMAEAPAFRQVLVNHAGFVLGETAAQVLATRAVYDTSEKVRHSALTNLDLIIAENNKLRKVARAVLLDGLRYPIPEFSKQAATAIIQLNDRDVIADLVAMLDSPNQAKPFVKKSKEMKQITVREVLRINHLRNCLVCHAPSAVSANPVPGIVPSIGQPLPPPTQSYYSGRRGGGIFVRADITYLRQQFSVMLPVKDHGKWPKMQRFDFLVRERPATKTEVLAWEKEKNMKSVNPYRQRILQVLEQLTGLELAANQKATRAAVAEWRRQMAIVDRNAKGR